MSTNNVPAASPPTLLTAFRYWLKLGFISFGGPAGQIAMMHQELVERRRWISENRFLHALNYCMVLPGPEAQQLAAYIGWLLHGTRGGLLAGVLFVLPSLFILIALTWVYLAYGHVSWVVGILYGIKPAVVAIVLFAAYRIGARTLRNAWTWSFALAALVAMAVFAVPFPYIVLAAGIGGYIGGQYRPGKFQTGGGHGGRKHVASAPAVIDDTTPVPLHALFRWSRFIRVALVGAALWATLLLALVAAFGWDATLTQMGWFFTKAALLTFGGAYAVLPYVYQGGVEQYHWLTATQMIDGLALGETTPGPLIMVVAFVGFVGAWTHAVFGGDAVWLAGIAGATVATVFTFLPSFVFIFLGAPFVEATRHNLKFTAPLTGITAAVVGVIVNLALFFAYHVFWPQGFALATPFVGFAWPAFAIGVLALLALMRFKVGIIPVICISAVLGLAVYAFAGGF